MADQKNLKEAVLYDQLYDNKVKCFLCNFGCVISEEKLGNCRVRKNISGKLYSMNYHKICAAGVDPIEKKPLFHFLPGSESFSIACPGCNFKCDFCQNWQISQIPETDTNMIGSDYSAEAIVQAAVDNNCDSISYTYTEPTIFMELANDCGSLAKERGLENVFVSNGFMTIEAVDFVKEWLGGINIDLKSFRDDFYKKTCKASLEPVLNTIRYIAANTDIWMELTTLVVPEQNDSEEELKDISEFVAGLRGGNVPWHISRFHPNYKMDGVVSTDERTIMKAYQLGKDSGVKYVYIGNMASKVGENTFCTKCGSEVIERFAYRTGAVNIKNGACGSCGAKVAGFFKK